MYKPGHGVRKLNSKAEQSRWLQGLTCSFHLLVAITVLTDDESHPISDTSCDIVFQFLHGHDGRSKYRQQGQDPPSYCHR